MSIFAETFLECEQSAQATGADQLSSEEMVKDIAYAAGYVVILHDDTQVCFHFILIRKKESGRKLCSQTATKAQRSKATVSLAVAADVASPSMSKSSGEGTQHPSWHV